MNERDLYGTAPRRGIAGPLIAVLIAFVLGVALTAVAVRRWDKLAGWLHPVAAKPVAIVAPPAPVRVIAPLAAPPADDSELTGRVDAIEARMDAIDQRAAAASGDADRAEALLVAFAARRALDRGQPLGYLEGLLRERFGATDAPAIALIIASAQRPVTLVQLQESFDTLKPALVASGPNESWWSGVRREFGSLFVVRRAAVPSNIPGDRVARAEHALEQGQVDVAATEIARLPGAPRAGDWLAAARRYLLARGALDQIETTALLKPAAAKAPLAAPAD